MKQKPSFQFYQQDFLGSIDVQVMSAEEIGCYCLLLFNCYNNGGKIPNDANALRMLCRGIAPAENVLKKFYANAEYLRHKRVDEEIIKQEKFSQEMSKASNKRWSKPQEGSSVGIAKAIGRQSSLSSSSSLYNKEIYKERKKIPVGENPLFDTLLEFCEKKSIQVDIPVSAYLTMREEYTTKVVWWETVMACVNWLHDNGHRKLNTNRLRRWMVNSVKFLHQKAIKQQQEQQDKRINNINLNSVSLTPHQPLWTPPS